MSLERHVLSNTPSHIPQDSIPSLLNPSEHRQVGEFLNGASLRHIHLDWQSLPAMLSDPLLCCWVLRQNGAVRSLLGATIYPSPEETKIAWLRLALPSTPSDRDPALGYLWKALQGDLVAQDVRQIGLLAIEPWIEELAARWGFRESNAVVTLRRLSGPMPHQAKPPLFIRPVDVADLNAVAQVDTAAFPPLWRHDLAALEAAHSQAATFTVIELAGDILGYQLSTWHIDAGHLARLAIIPKAQGHGLGKLLVGDMLTFFANRGITTVTVNTQADNLISQRLYAGLGFHATGYSVPVWILTLSN